MVKEIEGKRFEEGVLKSDVPVNFCASWCHACTVMYRVIEKLSACYRGKIKFFRVNIDEVQTIVDRYGITSIPTIMCFIRGKAHLKLSLHDHQLRHNTQ